MSIKRLAIDGYGQLELNQVAFRRDGRIEAQCKIDPALTEDYVENGMLLAVDKVAGTVGYPGTGSTLIGLHYSAETLYDERKQGLKYFKLDKNGFLPRIGYLAVGDRFTTNCLAYDDDEFDDDDAVKAATGTLYGVPCANGAIKITATPGDGVCLQVVAKTTMPDGQFAVKFVVIKA